MASFENVMRALENLGVRDVLLPFILIFTLSYAVLSNLPLFKDKKNLSVPIALAIGLAVVFPHVTGNYYYGGNTDVVNIINNSLPTVGLLLVVILSALILIGAIGLKFEDFGGSALGGILAIVCLLIVGYTFGTSAGWFNSYNMFDWLDTDMQALIFIVAIFYLMITFITGTGTSTETTLQTVERWLKALTQKK